MATSLDTDGNFGCFCAFSHFYRNLSFATQIETKQNIWKDIMRFVYLISFLCLFISVSKSKAEYPIEIIDEYSEKHRQIESITIRCYDTIEFPYKHEDLSELQTIWIRDVNDNCYNDLVYILNFLKHVETLEEIRFMDLNTILPIELWSLTQIKVLSIYDSDINAIPNEIEQLSNLEYLSLYKTNIKDLPVSVANLDSLKKVTLRSNGLTKIPAVIFQLVGLESLWLWENAIEEIPLEIANLKNLYTLELRDNNLTSIPHYISGLERLTSLNVSENQIQSLPDELTRLSNLIVIDLSINQIESLPDSIFTLPRLRELNLSDNRLIELPDKVPIENNLEYLNLSFNSLKHIPEDVFNFKGLRYGLGLADNQLTTLSPRVFDLKGIVQISLNGNPYTLEDLKIDFNKRFWWFYLITSVIKLFPFILFAHFIYLGIKKVHRNEIESINKILLFYVFISVLVGAISSWIIPFLHYHIFNLNFYYVPVFAEEWWKLFIPLFGAVITSIILLSLSIKANRVKLQNQTSS